MAYGSLGLGGFTQLGKFAQTPQTPYKGGLGGLPPTLAPEPKPPVVPPNDPQTEGQAGSIWRMAEMLDERDSNSRGGELSSSGVRSSGDPFSGATDFISREPGAMSIMGLSTGSAYDDLGRAYDTANFDIGGAVGGLAGNLLGGPIGGMAGSLLGRQADLNTVLGADRSRGRDFGQGGVGNMSSGEARAFEEARSSVMNRPAPTNVTQNEARMRQQAAQMVAGGYSGGGYSGGGYSGSDSNSRNGELTSSKAGASKDNKDRSGGGKSR